MNFVEFCTRRPAFTIVLSLLITVVGFIGYNELPIRWIPLVHPPEVMVTTAYPGASASLVESRITTPLETALASVNGIDTISSNSGEGSSRITINFKLGYNLNTATEDVRSALQRVTDSLPEGVKLPAVEKADPNGIPILYISFSDTKRSAKEVGDYVRQFIVPPLQTIDGVATVEVQGERLSAMRIWLDPIKMAASNVTADDVSQVLVEQNVQVPSGQIRGEKRFYSVVTNESLTSAEEFNNLIIRHDQNQTIRLKDIGYAVVDAANTDSVFRVNGQQAIGIAIFTQSTANPLAVAKEVLKEFSVIKKNLPIGMQGKVVFNQATYIEESVQHVYKSIFEAIGLVLLVIFLFLASWRAALIPIVTIPVCLIGTFAGMYWFGFSINTITLMALVLAIGLVVDDAIVMLENITRHIESGVKPFTAAIKGGREIVFPIIAMTLTLAAVYAPIAFVKGILGSVFTEFALTLTLAVLISGFVALTLSPMMCSRLLTSKNAEHNRYETWLNTKLEFLQTRYRILLEKILVKKLWVLLALMIIGIAGFGLSRFLASELTPAEDMGKITTYIVAPRNASFQFTDSYVRQLEEMYSKIPEIESYLSEINHWNASVGHQFISLVADEKRKRSALEIATAISEQVKNISGVNVYAGPLPSPLTWFGSDNGSSVALEVMTSGDYKELYNTMQRLVAAAKKYPGLQNVDNRLKWDSEQFEVTIDREKIADMNLAMKDITRTISILLAGQKVGYFSYGGKQYDVMLQMDQAALANPNIISQLYVRSNNNKMVSLGNLVSMKETTSPEMLPHYDRLRADVLSASLAPGYTIADAVNALQKITHDILPENTKIAFEGDAKNYLESSGKMAFTFLLALVFIYLILVAQFESFIDPFVILLTVPFAIIGALLTLKLTGGSLNIYSNIGLVTLIGLIAKHGILITEFANRQRMLGKSIIESVLDAAALRLRPILMTTAAMVLGAAPLALATGPGAETRHQLGWVIVGGLLFGTFFSLVVVPVAYTYLAKFKRKPLKEGE